MRSALRQGKPGADDAPVRHVVIPAAGLGSRLWPLSVGVPKELLPLGSYPALAASLLEAAALGAMGAGADGLPQVHVVTSPEKPGLVRLVELLRRPVPGQEGGLSAQHAALLAVAAQVRLQIWTQPQPAGVLDAIGCAQVPVDAPYAVLFPDLIHLPDQTALTTLAAAHFQTGLTTFGVRVCQAGDPPVSTLAVRLDGLPAGLSAGDQDRLRGPALPIAEVLPATFAPGEIVLTFGQINTPTLDATLRRLAKAQAQPMHDGLLPLALSALAKQGALSGVIVPGRIVDVGTLAGYRAACALFASGQAALRGLPI